MVVSIDECVTSAGIYVVARAMLKITGVILLDLYLVASAFRLSTLPMGILRHLGLRDINGYCVIAAWECYCCLLSFVLILYCHPHGVPLHCDKNK